MSPLPLSFANETWWVVTPTTVDDRGTSVPDWTASPVTSREVEGCRSWPGPSSDTTERRDGVQIQRTVLLPSGDPVLHTDGLKNSAGVLWLIEGDPARWESPTGRINCVAVELIRWEG